MAQSKKKIFLADKVSGLEGVAFALSICIRVIEVGNQRVKFKFPFWAFSVPPKSYQGTEWIQDEKYQAESEVILKFIQNKKGLAYFKSISEQITREEKNLEKEAASLRFQLAGLDNNQLVQKYDQFIKKYSRSYGLGVLTFIYEAILSEKLMKSLAMRSSQAAIIVSQLLKSSYRSFMLESEAVLLKIKQEKSIVRRTKLINNYLNQFFYIAASYKEAPIVTKQYVLQHIKDVNSGNYPQKTTKQQIKLLSWEKNLVELLKLNEIIRDKRKQINIIGSYIMFRFLDEAARRQKVNRSLLNRAFWFEYRDIFHHPTNLLTKLKKRSGFSIIFDQQSKRSFYLPYVALKERKAHIRGEKEVTGTPASAGVYCGIIRKVLSRRGFSAFKQGEIMLTTMTRPDFVPIMSKAAAVITDEGGLTCHAAIISRELKIPCIVGAKRATQIFNNGDLVEVDANQGTIKIIN